MLKSSLTKRIISAVIMIAVFSLIFFIIYRFGVGGRIFALIIAIAIGLYAYIEAVIITIKKYAAFLILGILSIVLIFALDYNLLINVIVSPHAIQDEFKQIFSWWTFVIPFLFIIPIMFLKNHDDDVTINNIFYTIMLLILLILFTKIIFVLTAIRWQLIGFVVLIAVIFDTSAYIFGVSMGRKFIKLPFTPRLSPKKSWEGFIGAYIVTMIFIGVFGYYANIFENTNSLKIVSDNTNQIIWLIVSMIFLPGACQVGDLFFSSIKRTKKIKDFASIIPGHGGIIDRLDGLIFVVIMFSAIFGLLLTIAPAVIS